MRRELTDPLNSLKQCVENAPAGTHERAKELDAILGSSMDQLMADLRAAGFLADSCDRAFELEAAMYDYVKRSNPGMLELKAAEGFGNAMQADEAIKKRVLENTTRDSAALNKVRRVSFGTSF